MTPDRMAAASVTVVGVPIDGWGGEPPAAVKEAAAGAEVVAVGERLLPAVTGLVGGGAEVVSITGDVAAAVDRIEAAARSGRPVVVFATGDPGYFGIGRAIAARLGAGATRVLPSPSSVAAAFGRLGLPWDDAVVVSAHGRPLAEAIGALAEHDKAAVLTAPAASPALVGQAIVEQGLAFEHVAVASDLGTERERVACGDLAWLAQTDAPALSVVLLWNGSGVSRSPVVATPHEAAAARASAAADDARFGLVEDAFAHRNGMITKAEVRTFCLARLGLPGPGILWDVGSGSGSIAVEASSLSPSSRVLAIERSPDDAARIRHNAGAHLHPGAVEVVEAEAPACFASLPVPDRVFVGGGGIAVLEAALAYVRDGGPVVATFASMDRAVAAAGLLGNLTQIAANRGVRLPGGSWRLVANDPVFVCWGVKTARARGAGA